jgi:hypothetical protein
MAEVMPAAEPAGSCLETDRTSAPDSTELARVIELPVPQTGDDTLFGVPGIGRATLFGAFLGFALVVLLVGAFVVATPAPASLLVAALHAGLFGGVGFGGMLGAVLQSIRYDTEQSQPASGGHSGGAS